MKWKKDYRAFWYYLLANRNWEYDINDQDKLNLIFKKSHIRLTYFANIQRITVCKNCKLFAMFFANVKGQDAKNFINTYTLTPSYLNI